jgi:hypothetical protein
MTKGDVDQHENLPQPERGRNVERDASDENMEIPRSGRFQWGIDMLMAWMELHARGWKTIDDRFQVHKNNMDRMNGRSIKNGEAQSSRGKKYVRPIQNRAVRRFKDDRGVHFTKKERVSLNHSISTQEKQFSSLISSKARVHVLPTLVELPLYVPE